MARMITLELPRIALGCGNFGGVGSSPAFFGQGLSQDQALELMDAAWQAGITYFDTADAYGGGRSEQAIGQWIRSRGVQPRLTTKTYNPMRDGADHGLRPERVTRQLRMSLDRLGVEAVELYLAHDFDHDVPLRESLAAFADAQAAGLIGAFGVSNFDAGQLAAALAAGAPRAVQNSRSLLDRQDEPDLLPLCAERHIAYLAFGPLAGGWLTGKYRRGEPPPHGSRIQAWKRESVLTDATFTVLEKLEAFAAERSITLLDVAIGGLAAQPAVSSVIAGATSPEQVAANAKAGEWQPTAADLAEIDQITTATHER